MSPFGWKPRARQQFSAGKTRICNRGTVAGQCLIRSGMHPFGWKPLQPYLERSNFQTRHINTTHRDSEQLRVSKTSCKPSSSWRKTEISQQQNGGGEVSTQIGHALVWLEAQGPTAVQCTQNNNLQQQNYSWGVSIQSEHAPVRLGAQGQIQQSAAGGAILRSSRTVAGQCQIRSGMQPFGWMSLQLALERSECQTRHI